jgi:cell division protein FtsB
MNKYAKWAALLAVYAAATIGHAQSTQMEPASLVNPTAQAMQQQIDNLENEVRELKAIVKQLQSGSASPASDTNSTGVVEDKIAPERQNLVQPEDRKISYMRRIERPY